MRNSPRVDALSVIVVLLGLALAVAGCGSDTSGSDSAEGGASVGGESSAGGSVGVGGGTSTSTGGTSSAGGSSSGAGGSASNAPTWSRLWTNYFQGACASCHASSSVVGNSLVFGNALQLCTVLTNRQQLNGTTVPPLISSNQSVLTWFSANGSMPEGSRTAPANAVNDIKAWAAAGAVCP